MKTLRPRARHFVTALLVSVLIGACAPTEVVNGHVPTPDELADIRPGVTDRDSVAELLGTPSSAATFESAAWYYITRKTEQVAFFKPAVIEQRVVAIHFDDAGIVKEIKHYTEEDGRIIDPVTRKTPTRGRELTVMEQLFGNLGRFSKQ